MKKKISKIMIFLYGIFCLIIAPGCWDNRDIVERAFASAVALDKGEKGEIEVTLQILKPNIIKAKQEGGDGGSTFSVFSTTGDTIFEAMRNQLKNLNRKPFFSHLGVIVIGEDLAREGIRDVLDIFTRHNEVKITPRILVTKGIKAKDIMNAESEIEAIPAQHIQGILDNNISEAKTRDMRLIDVLQELTSPWGNTVIGNITPLTKGKITKIKDLEIEGAAIINRDKLVEFLDAEQTRGYLHLKNEVKGGAIVVNNPMEKGKKVSIMIKNAQGKIRTHINNGALKFIVDIKMKGNLWEEQGAADLSNQEMLERVEKEVEKEIKGNIEEMLKVAKEKCKCDFIGFGNEVARHYPEYWEEVRDNWNQEFIETPVGIEVKVELSNTGVITKPIDIQQKVK